MEELTIFDFMKDFVLWLSPVVFAVGVLLVLSPKLFGKIEGSLGKEIGGIKKKVIPQLEMNIESFQNWMLKKNNVVGLILVVLSFVFFLLLR
ncbi:MAG: hypothetical protein P9L96_05660 [Candidatus Gygaella obscura]|nr:hypothetical protein [Candidatus Gygaella obscura]